jgi:hypothetical protein
VESHVEGRLIGGAGTYHKNWGLAPWQAESCSTIDEGDVEVEWQCLEGFQKVDENPGSYAVKGKMQ